MSHPTGKWLAGGSSEEGVLALFTCTDIQLLRGLL